MRHFDSFPKPRESMVMGMSVQGQETGILSLKGRYILHLTDSKTGEVLDHRELDNLVTLDAGVLMAILFAAGPNPVPAQSGLTMLGMGTGATGPILGPDAPDARQRHLNAEAALGRKPFTITQFRTALGAVSGVPTNIVDLTASFGEGEAVGPLNEMGLMRTISQNVAVQNPVVSTFPAYDTTINLTLFDVLVNYTTFSVLSKPSASILAITWRLTF